MTACLIMVKYGVIQACLSPLADHLRNCVLGILCQETVFFEFLETLELELDLKLNILVVLIKNNVINI